MTGSGFRLPANRAVENQMWYWSNHIDHSWVSRGSTCSTKPTGITTSRGAGAFGIRIGGGDLFNLGSVGMAGENMVTGAYGVKYKPADNKEIVWLTKSRTAAARSAGGPHHNVNFIVRFLEPVSEFDSSSPEKRE